MSKVELYDQLVALVGKRSDDPAVLAFHKEHKLKAPPSVTKLDLLYSIIDKKRGYAINYQGEIRLPGYYPPQREGGKYVAYVASLTLYEDYAGPIAGDFDTALAESKAKEVALQIGSTALGNFYTLKKTGNQLLKFVYLKEGGLHQVRVLLDQLAKDDAQLKELAKKKSAAPARVLPKRQGVAQNEPLPAALADLALHGDFGDIDMEMLAEIETGGPQAWTNNPEAELELRVFAVDGAGGLVAFWLVHESKPLEAQPIVFLGSQGEVGAVAKDLADFFHLLAHGIGPHEVVELGATEGGDGQTAIAALAKKHFAKRKARSAADIVADAQGEFADIVDRIKALNKH